MGSFFSSIDLLSSALSTFQTQLETTGHNIANVDTPGYSEQSVQLGQMTPMQVTEGNPFYVGQGVTIQGVTRARDMFLQARLTTSNSAESQFSAQSSSLNQVQSVFSDATGNGISAALNQFWNSWSGLASNPSQVAGKLAVQQAGQTLTDQVRGTYAQLQTMQQQVTSNIQQSLSTLQTDANQLAKLNAAIAGYGTSPVQAPNDLLDQRDQLIQNMSGIADISVQQAPNGTDSVYLNQFTLVDQSGARTLPTNFNAATATLTDANGSYNVHSGQLMGLFNTLNQIGSYEGSLNTLANTMRTQVNALFETGVNSYGATGLKFFNDSSPQTGAVDFNLDSTGVTGPPSSPGVANDPNAIATGTSGNASDGSLALAISQMQSTTYSALGNNSFNDFYGNLVSQIGSDTQTAQTNQTTQQAVVQQVNAQIQSVSGVSLDQEMTNMMRFQAGYQAAAKALSSINTTMDSLINMI